MGYDSLNQKHAILENVYVPSSSCISFLFGARVVYIITLYHSIFDLAVFHLEIHTYHYYISFSKVSGIASLYNTSQYSTNDYCCCMHLYCCTYLCIQWTFIYYLLNFNSFAINLFFLLLISSWNTNHLTINITTTVHAYNQIIPVWGVLIEEHTVHVLLHESHARFDVSKVMQAHYHLL